jgi:site-specific DNA-cytosine methylase
VRATDGLAGRLDDRGGLELAAYRRTTRPHSADEGETWDYAELANNVNGWDQRHGEGNELVEGAGVSDHDPLLPLGLDSHRYRCCGNGVVADVAEWIGGRLMAVLEVERAA